MALCRCQAVKKQIFKHLDVVGFRVLFLAADQAVALTRNRAGLSCVGRFRADDSGRAALGRWLRTPPCSSLYLIVDLAKEEFRRETVPHVRWSERSALLERKLSRLFPDTVYRCARVQGREDTGRRDDMVLFSSLPGNGQLAPWVETVLANGAPLAGITSVSMLSETEVALHHGDVSQLLLVSHQQETGLRQSYFLHGRLQFSLLHLGFGEGQGESLLENLLAECVRTRQYLVRQKLLLPGQVLEIHLQAEGACYERYAEAGMIPPFLSLHVHDTGALLRRHGLEKGVGIIPASVFSCMLAARWSSGLPNHYAPPALLRFQRLRRLRRGVVSCAGIIGILSCLGAWFLYAQGSALAVRQHDLRIQAHSLRQRHDVLRRDFPHIAMTAREVKQAVEFIDAMGRLPSPRILMQEVSRALAACPEIRLHRFVWQATPPADQAADQIVADPGSAGHMPEPGALFAAVADGSAMFSVFLAGSVVSFSGHRSVHQAISRFAAALERESGFMATPVRTPLEMHPGAGLEAGLAERDGQDSVSFILRLAGNRVP